MNRLVGGDYLLDLSPIEIEESVDGATYTSITDKSVLDQLTNLSSFIGKSGMMKTVWVKLLNGETDETIVTRGSLSTSDGTTFLIKVLLAGFVLTLSVEFTQAETEDHTPLNEWYIDTNDAKYILISDTQSLAGELADFEGDVSITGDLTVTGEINGEENPSVKPIYFHPIRFTLTGSGGGETFRVKNGSFFILNNSDEALDTYAKIHDYLYNEGTAMDILCSIDYYDADGLYKGQILKVSANVTTVLLTVTTDGVTTTDVGFNSTEITDIADAVNKIN